MLGLPTEEDEDIKGIAYLAEKIAEHYYEIPKDQRNGKCQITVSTSFLRSEALHAVPVGSHEYP